jgi:DNA-directed RNA polymerase specialized sigma24 family protein
MTTNALDLHFLTFINDQNEDNYQSLMQACFTYAKTYMSLHPELELYHNDIARDVAHSAMKSATKLHTDGPFQAWLYRVTLNKIIDYQRKIEWRKQDEYVEESFKQPTFTLPREVSDLEGLSEFNRSLLNDIEDGYSLDDTPKRHGITRKAFDSRMDRLKAKIKAAGNV